MNNYLSKARDRLDKRFKLMIKYATIHQDFNYSAMSKVMQEFIEQELKGLLEEVKKKPKEKSERDYIAIGFHKGEMDFSINCSIGELTKGEMDELRIMTCVAIGQAEQMWREKRQKLLGLQTSRNRPI